MEKDIIEDYIFKYSYEFCLAIRNHLDTSIWLRKSHLGDIQYWSLYNNKSITILGKHNNFFPYSKYDFEKTYVYYIEIKEKLLFNKEKYYKACNIINDKLQFYTQ